MCGPFSLSCFSWQSAHQSAHGSQREVLPDTEGQALPEKPSRCAPLPNILSHSSMHPLMLFFTFSNRQLFRWACNCKFPTCFLLTHINICSCSVLVSNIENWWVSKQFKKYIECQLEKHCSYTVRVSGFWKCEMAMFISANKVLLTEVLIYGLIKRGIQIPLWKSLDSDLSQRNETFDPVNPMSWFLLSKSIKM